MVAVLDPGSVDAAVALLAEHGIRAWPGGEIVAGSDAGGRVRLMGDHPGW
jgi:phosphoribosylformylglycinamidine cyclo-ligase